MYEKTKGGAPTVDDIMRTGNDIVAAGYCMYGAATELVVCFKGTGVERFALDPSLGEFIHTHSNVTFPEGGGKKIYACNEGNSLNWDEKILESVKYFKENKYAARYVGSMVSDVHRTILYGGIFMYPADKKSPKGARALCPSARPRPPHGASLPTAILGKLRVLYEGFPMALIVEKAGGVASTGLFNGKARAPQLPISLPTTRPPRPAPRQRAHARCSRRAPVQRMLDLEPGNIHDRCPVILGSPRDVDLVLSRYK